MSCYEPIGESMVEQKQREDAVLAERMQTRLRIAQAIAVAIGHAGAFSSDYGLSYAERGRCYAAADRVMPFLYEALLRERGELAKRLERLPRHRGMEAPTAGGWVRAADVLALLQPAGDSEGGTT